MSNTDKSQSDTELAAYLDGRDGVSRTYRAAAHEQPPAALDQAILAAARRAVQPPQPRPIAKHFQHWQALAASVMVGVISVALYVNQRDLPVPLSVNAELAKAVTAEMQTDAAPATPAVADAESKERLQVELQDQLQIQPQAQRQDAVVLEEVQITGGAMTPQLPANDFSVRQLPAPTAITSAAPAPPTVPAAIQPAETNARQAAANTEQPVVIRGRLLEAIEQAAQAQAAATQNPAPAARNAVGANAQAAVAEASSTSVEEVMVTGARITRAPGAAESGVIEEIVLTGTRVLASDFSYRQEQARWVEVIQDFTEQLAELENPADAEAVAERDEWQQRLAEEKALFSEAYPTVDLEAVLLNGADD